VIVHDFQLSLAIGKEGQNARLAARLTGWRIDIKSESQLADEEAGGAEGWAEGEWVQSESGEMVFQPAGGGAAISMEEWERNGVDGVVEEGDTVTVTAELPDQPDGATGAGNLDSADASTAEVDALPEVIAPDESE
jgi:N utilization substance protein A